MSTIDPRLSTSLPTSFDALERQGRVDSGLDPVLAELAGDEASLEAPALSPDVAVLMAQAEGPGTFAIADQRASLAGLERGQAVEQGVDDIVASWA